MATTVQVQQPPTFVTTQVPLLPPQPPRNLSSNKGLAVTQLVIGILCLLFGIASVTALVEGSIASIIGAGIWAGVFIIVAGIIGVCSTQNYNNKCLNGVYMAFSIVSSCASFVAGIIFILTVIFPFDESWHHEGVSYGIHIPLLLMMIVEFCVSIAAAILCCQNCCRNIIVPQQVVMVPASGSAAGAYPANVGQYQQYGGQVVPQYGGQVVPQYGGQVVPQYGGQVMPQYGVQYTPQYNAQVPTQYISQVPPVQPPVGAQPQYPQQETVDFPEKPPPGYSAN